MLKVIIEKILPLGGNGEAISNEVVINTIQTNGIFDAQVDADRKEVQKLTQEVRDAHEHIHADKASVETSEANALMYARASDEAATASEQFAADSQIAADAALASKNAAKASETAALASKNAAKASETNAKASEVAAKDSEDAALASKNAAKTSEANAKASETAALASKNAAKTSETNAKASEVASKASEVAAKDSETWSANHAAVAARLRKETEAFKNEASISEANAKASETAALASKNAAKASETNTANHAAQVAEDAAQVATDRLTVYNDTKTAIASKNAAIAAQVAAETAQAGAESSEDAALASKNAAKASETAAAASENSAATSASTATTKANEALTSANKAKTSETNAKASEVAAKASELKAAEYAATLAGGLLDGGNIDLSSGSYPAIPTHPTFWKITVAGVVSGIDYGIGDTLVYSKVSGFYKIDNTESVTSVNGKKGVVTISRDDLSVASWSEIGLTKGGQFRATGATSSGAIDIDVNTIDGAGVFHKMIQESGSANSANCGTGYHYIEQFKYGTTSNVTQIAIPYGTSARNRGRLAYRSRYSDVFDDWSYIYSTNNKPTWDDVGGKVYVKDDGTYLQLGQNKWLRAGGSSVGYLPSAAGTGADSKSSLGSSTWWFANAYVNNYKGGTVDVSGSVKGNKLALSGWDFTQHTNGNIELRQGENRNLALYISDENYSAQFSGLLYENGGARVYSTTNKPTAADVGAFSKSESDARYLNGNSAAKFVKVNDTREAAISPNGLEANAVTFQFTDKDKPVGAWFSKMSVKGWTDNYVTWELGSCASSTTDNTKLWFRTGRADAWNHWEEVYTTGNKPTAADVGAVDLTTDQTIRGNKLFVNDVGFGGDLSVELNKCIRFNRANAGFGWGIREFSSSGALEFVGRSGTGEWGVKAYIDGSGRIFSNGEQSLSDSALTKKGFTDATYAKKAGDTFTGLIDAEAGIQTPNLRIQRQTTSNTGDDVVDITADDGGLVVTVDNQNDSGSGNVTFKYKATDGTPLNSLAFSHSSITFKGHKVYHAGNKPTFDEINPIKTITKTLTVGNDWVDTGISGTQLETGSYMVALEVHHNGFVHETFTGMMSWYSGATASNKTNEIMLHSAGQSTGYPFKDIFLRTKRNQESVLTLEISASELLTEGSYKFKFRKLI
ncbi:hypothetical protein EX461_18070 [Vibrio parahaemolyticus]|nr:hypothetical protein [Vibrio parahaemolyticus]